ncbi:MAG: hypothetical protein WCS94_15055 [Verrucomicrobiota bacterium]
MTSRLAFLAIAAFWLTMNGLLWRSEFGVRGGDTPVPAELVWQKILTAPDASSLSVFQNGERMGYCEFSTAVGQQMATLDDASPPPDSFGVSAGYQVHLAGNISFGDFTNRLKFDGRIYFNSHRQWRECNLKISARLASVEIHSQATNQSVRIKISNEGEMVERELTFDELQNPEAMLRTIAGNSGIPGLGLLDLPQLLPAGSFTGLRWEARRTRVKIGTEAVPVYQLETGALGYTVTVDVSTLGEILRVQLPGGIRAHIDEWSRP